MALLPRGRDESDSLVSFGDCYSFDRLALLGARGGTLRSDGSMLNHAKVTRPGICLADSRQPVAKEGCHPRESWGIGSRMPSSLQTSDRIVDTPAGDAAVRVEVLRSLEQFRARQSEWDAFLAEAAGEHAYMHDHSLIMMDLELNRSSYLPLFMIVWEGNKIQCLAPFYVERQPYRMSLGVMKVAAPMLRMLKIYGGSIVHRLGRPPELGLHSIFDTLRSWRRSFDTIAFFELPVGGDLWTYFEKSGWKRSGFKLIPASSSPSVLHFIEMSNSYDAYLASFGSKRRKAWRKVIRQFEARCPKGFEVVRVTEPDQAMRFLEDVDRVFPTTWQARVLAPRRHAKPANVDFYRTIAAQGRFRAYTLKVNGEPIAFSSGFQHNGVYYFDETGYDIAWREGNPGTVLLLRIMEDLHEHDPPRVCHFGYGDGLQKRTFGTRSVGVTVVHIVPDGALYGRNVVRLARWMDSFSGALRKLVTKVGIDGWLRERLKRGRYFGRSSATTTTNVVAAIAFLFGG